MAYIKKQRDIYEERHFKGSADPFYSESNIRYLEKKVQAYREGKLHFAEHELIGE